MRTSALLPIFAALTAAACAPLGGRAEDPPPVPGGDCAYGAPTDPMTLGEVLPPFAWDTARLPDGTITRADLADAPCGDDPLWSPFDALVFISIPAW